MNGSILLLIGSLFYIILIMILYFSKNRIQLVENKIYEILLFTGFFGIIIDIFGILAHLTLPDTSILRWLIVKFYFVYLLTFVFSITTYIFISAKRNKEKDYKQYCKKIVRTFLCLYLILFIINFILPFSYYNDGNLVYVYGPNAQFLYAITAICIVGWLVYIFSNFKKLEKRKYYPMIAFAFIATPVALIQMMNPQLLLVTAAITFIIVLMYHTIENPDMHLIEQLNIARDQAEKANNAKTDFLSNMSHEIRTPLNAIVGFSQALLEEDINARSKEEVKDIMMASENLLDIVNGILDISKIEANKLEIINKEYQFSKIIDELISLSKGRIGEKPLEFRVNIDPTIPPVLYGDYVRLKQIILNLLTNAIKYTREGYVDFTISCVKKDSVCRLIIAVEDSGMGIKNEKIDRLFTKFERFEVDRNTTIEGTGLGLAITKKLVDLMGGNIVVQSEYGHGSKFTVAIDQHIIKNPKKLEDTAILEKVIDATNKKVLIVDDNTVNLKVASRLLQSYNVISEEVSSGQECIEKIKNGDGYDLILLDIMMPIMNGVDTLSNLKKIKDFDIPVVALTADAISGMKEKYLSDGFDGYLAKPIDKIELNRIINQFLSK